MYAYDLPTTGSISFADFCQCAEDAPTTSASQSASEDAEPERESESGQAARRRACARWIAEATKARVDVRGVLKALRHGGGGGSGGDYGYDDEGEWGGGDYGEKGRDKGKGKGEKDWLGAVKVGFVIVLVLEEYLPLLYGIIMSVDNREITFKSMPVFSWRPTLSATPTLSISASPARLSLPTLHSELAFVLLTYALAQANHTRVLVRALGAYERARTASEEDRKVGDAGLTRAVAGLCTAAGVLEALAEGVVPEWEKRFGESMRGVGEGVDKRPVDLSREVVAALAKTLLADAQTLAIRKLLSKARWEETLTPGPPLPKSHPSPALIAKLHLECAALYSSARGLVGAVGKRGASSGGGSNSGGLGLGKLKSSLKVGKTSSPQPHGQPNAPAGEVAPGLRRHLEREAMFHGAMGRKWLGVDAGEAGRCGEAVGFLAWAQRELEELGGKSDRSSNAGMGISGGNHKEGVGQGGKGEKRAMIQDEKESVGLFLRHYRKINDSITFQGVLKQSELATRIPAGRLAVSVRPWTPPRAAFELGRGARESDDAKASGGSALRWSGSSGGGGGKGDESSSDDEGGGGGGGGSYAGAGSYF
ncbi:hypothetical protein BJ138DRAFT_1130269 [Hygrophoropsis aurantiaca]|uniref:Uncharacterized protein n=1 Tax=Hygrophoropsis aurantiaca TaxID=72124 RepID=A0ACB7ZXU5_9AGAM|nr:hypothetical protein BJ138DRAFT_1130269 [Hygrophoropsis aurantiaca]